MRRHSRLLSMSVEDATDGLQQQEQECDQLKEEDKEKIATVPSVSHYRRMSIDDLGRPRNRQFLVNVQRVRDELLAREDTNCDAQVTIEDRGPKLMLLPSAASHGFYRHCIRGTYQITSLLQELIMSDNNNNGDNTLHHHHNHHHQVMRTALIEESRITENPVDRFKRLVRTVFWPGLQRSIDAGGMARLAEDSKDRRIDGGRNSGSITIHIPIDDRDAMEYYGSIGSFKVAPYYGRGSGGSGYSTGILCLASERTSGGYKPLPFTVPGGRFNEMYGWDSYFIGLGLLADVDEMTATDNPGDDDGTVQHNIHLAMAMVEHLCYEIKHYGMILNANRPYYLGRSQPPFLTDFALQTYQRMKRHDAGDADSWLQRVMGWAIREYRQVWMSTPRRCPMTGLSRYSGGEGNESESGESGATPFLGFPPETEPGHYAWLLEPLSRATGMSIGDLEGLAAQPSSSLSSSEGSVIHRFLRRFLAHDRAMRESGHDTSFRFEGVAADLVTVDLNSLLFKYERDILHVIEDLGIQLTEAGAAGGGGGAGENGLAVGDGGGTVEDPATWRQAAEWRRAQMTALMWNPERGLFYDWNTERGQQNLVDSATTLWTLWAGLASPEQAARLVPASLAVLEQPGGLVSTSARSGASADATATLYSSIISSNLAAPPPPSVLTILQEPPLPALTILQEPLPQSHLQSQEPLPQSHLQSQSPIKGPPRQWDYPYGWAPHQILGWAGLERYGYVLEAQRLAYRWLHMLLRAFVDYGGAVTEKYNVVDQTHRLPATLEYGNVGGDFQLMPREGFGWTNASFILGLRYLDRRLRRALGALLPYL